MSYRSFEVVQWFVLALAILLAIILGETGLFYIYVLWGSMRVLNNVWVSRKWAVAVGKVSELVATDDRDKARFEYRVADRAYFGETDAAWRLEVGGDVSVRYDPHSPSEYLVVRRLFDSTSIVLIVVGLVGGLGFLDQWIE